MGKVNVHLDIQFLNLDTKINERSKKMKLFSEEFQMELRGSIITLVRDALKSF